MKYVKLLLVVPVLLLSSCGTVPSDREVRLDSTGVWTHPGIPDMEVNWHREDRSFGSAYLHGDLLLGGKTVRAFDLNKKQFAFKTDFYNDVFSDGKSLVATDEYIIVKNNYIDKNKNDRPSMSINTYSYEGKLLNRIPLEEPLANTAQFLEATEHYLYVAADGYVYKFNRADLLKKDAKPIWMKHFPKGDNVHSNHIGTLYAPDDEHLYVAPGSRENRIVSLDPKTGDEKWSVQVAKAGRMIAGPQKMLQYKNNIIVLSNGEGGLMSFDMETGKKMWNEPSSLKICPNETGEVANEMIIAEDKVFVSPWTGSCVFAYSAKTGEVAWVFQHKYSFGVRPLYHNGVVYVANGQMFALDAGTGKRLAQGNEFVYGTTGESIIYDSKRNQILVWSLRGLHSYKPVR